jgi:multidrug resistance efflux pump
MKINSFYILVVVLLGALFFLTKKLYNGSGKSWVGIAEAKDYTISSEKQATVQALRVVQGQAIAKGDTLIILASQKLNQDIDKLENKIATLQSEKAEKQNLIKSEIDLLMSTQSIEVNRLEKEITQAESELKLNKSLTAELKLGGDSVQASPLEVKIKSLKEEIALRNQSFKIKINDIRVKNNTDQLLLQNQIQLLQNELALLKGERQGLIKIASSDGVVQSVPVKAGEEVDAYTHLLSILPKSPTSVIGYLQGEKENPTIGTKVQLLGYDARWKMAEGKVIGYGAITALPEILQKSTAVKAFGKEIFIELPAQNDFSSGEKLLIRLWEN